MKKIKQDFEENEDEDEEEDSRLIQLNQILLGMQKSIQAISENQASLQKQISIIQTQSQQPRYLQIDSLVLSDPLLKLSELSTEAGKILETPSIKNFLEITKKNRLLGSLSYTGGNSDDN
jgi:hypothetical protein